MEKSFPWGYWQVKKKRRRKRDIHTLFFPPAAAHNDCGFWRRERDWNVLIRSILLFYLSIFRGESGVCALWTFLAPLFSLIFSPQRGGWLKFIFREKIEHPLLAHITFSNFEFFSPHSPPTPAKKGFAEKKVMSSVRLFFSTADPAFPRSLSVSTTFF